MRVLLCAFVACLAVPATGTAGGFPLHPGSHGQHVRNLQWLLAGHKPAAYRYGFYKGKITGRLDPATAKALKATKWRLGYPTNAAKQPVATPLFFKVMLHKVQRPLAWRLAAGRRANRATTFKPQPAVGPAGLLVRDAGYLIDHAPLVRYTQGTERMSIVRGRVQLPPLLQTIWEDCSSSVTGLFLLAGLGDPNGLGYSGQGYTGTLADHGRVVWRLGEPLTQLRPGDLVFYGQPPFSHVTLYLGRGRVFSHGSDLGPFDLPVLYRGDAFYARRYF